MLGPMWRHSSVMNDWQKCMISLLDLPLGSKSEPPLPPPMGSVVRLFLRICSRPRNFQHAERNRGVEAKAALVGANGRVELDAIAAIDLDLSRIIDPRHAEHDDALRLDKTLEQSVLFIFGMSIKRRAKRAQDFRGCLDEFGLVGVFGLKLFKGFVRRRTCNSPLRNTNAGRPRPRDAQCVSPSDEVSIRGACFVNVTHCEKVSSAVKYRTFLPFAP